MLAFNENILEYALIINIIAVLISVVAVIYWVKLYKRLYKQEQKETRGWVWLFIGVFSILLFNISSIYLMFFSNPFYELLGTMGRTLIAISLTIGAYLLYLPMKKGFVYRFVPIEPVIEHRSEEKPRHILEKGQTYLIDEEKPIKSNEIFLDMINHGIAGLYITRKNPEEVRKNYKLEKTPIIWLTHERSYNGCIDPRDLVLLSHTIKEFIKKADDGIVLIDGVEYLIIQNSFVEILKLVQNLKDVVSLSNSRMLLSIDSKAIDNREFHLLKKDMSFIKANI
ncbi:MAG: DUF835 domain-containing protein [Candidatus Altiarchaeota archaeon]